MVVPVIPALVRQKRIKAIKLEASLSYDINPMSKMEKKKKKRWW